MTSESQKIFAFRLRPGDDLKEALAVFVKDNSIKAGYIITCAGSLQQANLRFAGQTQGVLLKEKFEIISLTGTLSVNGMHLHISISDSVGKTIGGHLLDGNRIYTTAELVIGEALYLKFERQTDPATGYNELDTKPRL